jgi:hypothetical protein
LAAALITTESAPFDTVNIDGPADLLTKTKSSPALQPGALLLAQLPKNKNNAQRIIDLIMV